MTYTKNISYYLEDFLNDRKQFEDDNAKVKRKLRSEENLKKGRRKRS